MNMDLTYLSNAYLSEWGRSLLLIALAGIGVLLAHALALHLMSRIASRTRSSIDNLLLSRLRQPSRFFVVALAFSAIQPSLAPAIAAFWQAAAGFVVPGLVGWVILALLGVVHDVLLLEADVAVSDNLQARRRRTRVSILYRIALFMVLLVTFSTMLLAIPTVRSVGVTLIASAGLAALAVGAAAQPALRNLIAGLQMAFTEPIRIDDVVIVDNEWGRIEQIGLTYVVVRIWDDRRLIVPLSRFLEQGFQNWTRETSQLLGTAFLHVDPVADVPRIRAKLEAVVRANETWDGRVVGLQVTELHVDHMELRALVSAADAGKLFDLRCDVREAMAAFIAAEMPEALPRARRSVVHEAMADDCAGVGQGA